MGVCPDAEDRTPFCDSETMRQRAADQAPDPLPRRPGEALIVPDARYDPRFAQKSPMVAAPHVRFYAGVMIVDGFGYRLGALCMFDDKPRADETDIAMPAHLARGVEQIISR